MKKRLLSALLAVCMVLTMIPTVFAADGDIAQIGETTYATLADAVAAAEDEAEIILLDDASGDGVVIDKDITLDLNGNTYTISDETVGSAGTETLGFQILKNNAVTIQNGTINTNTDACKMLVQNYANLTLDDVTLDGTGSTTMQYVMSNNCGEVELTGETNIFAPDDAVALDSCKYASYSVPTVTVNTTGAIDGKIELTGGNFVVEQGTFTDLKNAVENAAEGAVITLLEDAAGDGIVINEDVTIDLDGNTYTVSDETVGSVGTVTLGFQILKNNTVTIQNGTLNTNTDACKMLVQNYANLTLDNVTLDGTGSTTMQYVMSNNCGEVELTGETNIFAPDDAVALDSCKYASYSVPTVTVNTTGVFSGKLEVTGGTLKLENGSFESELIKDSGILEISGGYYTNNPTAFLAEGYITLTSDDADYNYMVAVKQAGTEEEPEVDAAPTTVVAGEPTVKIPENIDIDAAEVKAAASAEETVESLNEIAHTIKNDTEISAENAAEELAAVVDGTVAAEDVTIVIQPYLEVEVKSVTTDDNGTVTMELDIGAYYDTIATNANNPEDVAVGTNAVVLEEKQPLETKGQEISISVPLPAEFAQANEVYVKHIKDNGTTYVYKAVISGDGRTVTFVNPNGFSKFVLSSEIAAQIGDTYYASLEDAIAAVENNETIRLLADNDEEISVCEDLTFTIDTNGKSFDEDNITAGAYTDVEVTEDNGKFTYAFDYYRASTSGSSKKDPVAAVKRLIRAIGKVELNDADRIEDAREAYDDLTAAQKKKITNYDELVAAEKQIAELLAAAKTELPFTDVSKNDSYYAAVKFVYENGLMVGVGDGTPFAPKMPLSRAMTARILHTLEKNPAAAASTFSDVARDFWYTGAIDWASASGIVSGYGDGTFGPNDNVSREQLAVMLYQYAKTKGYNVTLGAALTQTDAAAISHWASEAVQWAVNHGILTENGVGYLAATDAATRSDVAQAFMAFLQL